MSTNLGTRLRRIRKHRGLGVNELAKKCYMHGSIVSGVENQKHKNVALIHLRRLAKVLGVTIDELVVGPLDLEKQAALIMAGDAMKEGEL